MKGMNILTHLYTVFRDRITTTEAPLRIKQLNNLPTNCIIFQFPVIFSRVLTIFAACNLQIYKTKKLTLYETRT